MQVSSDGQFRYASSRWFATALERLKVSGVHGMAIDVWVSLLALTCVLCISGIVSSVQTDSISQAVSRMFVL